MTLRRRQIGLQAAVMLVAVAVAACQGSAVTAVPSGAPGSGAPPAAPSPVGSTASQPVVSVGQPVSMTLPASWRKVELTDAGLRAVIRTLGASNPRLSTTLNQLLTSGAYLRLSLYALGYDGERYIGNANIAETPLPSADLAALGPLLEAQLRSLGAKDVSTTTVTLPAGSALRLSYTLAVASGTTTVPVTGRLFVFAQNGLTYNVTFTCGGPDPGLCLGQVDQMIQTFRIGG
jgi:hypothetical protein